MGGLDPMGSRAAQGQRCRIEAINLPCHHPLSLLVNLPKEGQLITMAVDSLCFSHYPLFIIYFGGGGVVWARWWTHPERTRTKKRGTERARPIEFPPNLAVRRFISK